MAETGTAVISTAVIAHIRSDFATKFGVPRQSGVVPETQAAIVFEPPYRVPEALRGLESFSHLWLLWHFSEVRQTGWSPTVRPPRLGGNARMGVFATRSPYRPNPIGLSSVKLLGIDLHTPDGPVLRVAGADLMDGTPILDIKPYLPYTDSHPEAAGGFTAGLEGERLAVSCPEALLSAVPNPNPYLERGKKLLVYDPSVHDYRTDKPQWVEILPGHFIYGNERELDGYRKELTL